jgi:hypothetical protein
MTIRVLAVGNNNTDQVDHRSLITALTTTQGAVAHRPGLFPSSPAGAALTNVSAMVAGVGEFKAIIANPTGPGQFLVQSDAVINVTFAAGEAAVVRNDRIIARVYNSAQDGSGVDDATVEYLKGQSSGAGTAVPNGAILLWEFPVPAGASSGSGGINFTSIGVDKRVWTSASGGIIPALNSAEVVAISGAYNGEAAYAKDISALYIHDGTSFKVRGQASVASSANLTSISNAWDGLLVTTRDTNHIWQYDGSAWFDTDALPRVKVYTTGGAVGNNAVQVLPFDAESYKTVSTMHNNTTNNSRLVVPKTGLYAIAGGASFALHATGRREMQFRKNANAIATGGTRLFENSYKSDATDITTIGGYCEAELVAGDYIEMFLFENCGFSLAINGGADLSWASIRLCG